MRLIDADKLLDILDVMIVGHKSASDVYDVVDSMPTVDVDSVSAKHEDIGYEKGYRDGYAELLEHGRWASSQGLAEAGEVQCSICKTIYYADDLYNVGETDEDGIGQALMPNFCPHCGAYMGGGEDETD